MPVRPIKKKIKDQHCIFSFFYFKGFVIHFFSEVQPTINMPSLINK